GSAVRRRRSLCASSLFKAPWSFHRCDGEVVEGAARPLAEEPLAHRDRHAPLRRFRMLEREGVDATQEPVPDVHGSDLVDEELAPPERRVGAGVRDTLDVEWDPNPVDSGDLAAV